MALRDAVLSIGMVLIALGVIIAVLVLALTNNAIPSELWLLETTLVGAIAGTTLPNRKD